MSDQQYSDESNDVPSSPTPYDQGYDALPGAMNPYSCGTYQRGDWNQGYLDKQGKRPRNTSRSRHLLNYRKDYTRQL